MLVDSAIALIRDQVQDPNGVRWTKAKVVGYLNAGERFVFGKRPDAFYKTAIITDYSSLTAIADAPAVTDVLNIADRYAMALVHYAVASLLREDADDEHNQRLAEQHDQEMWKELGFNV
jgi:hypothetical protein